MSIHTVVKSLPLFYGETCYFILMSSTTCLKKIIVAHTIILSPPSPLPPLPHSLLNESQSELLAFQGALREYVLSLDGAYGKSYEEFYVGFVGR